MPVATATGAATARARTTWSAASGCGCRKSRSAGTRRRHRGGVGDHRPRRPRGRRARRARPGGRGASARCAGDPEGHARRARRVERSGGRTSAAGAQGRGALLVERAAGAPRRRRRPDRRRGAPGPGRSATAGAARVGPGGRRARRGALRPRAAHPRALRGVRQGSRQAAVGGLQARDLRRCLGDPGTRTGCRRRDASRRQGRHGGRPGGEGGGADGASGHRPVRGPAQRRRVSVQRHQPDGRAADHEPRAGGHLRPDGHHQHGPRRDAHDRLLHGLRRAGDFPGAVRGLAGLLLLCRAAARVPGRRARGVGPRARRHPLSLRPAARDADRHLGRRDDPAAGRPSLLWRPDQRQLADVVPGWRGGACRAHLPVEPDLHRRAGARLAGRALGPPLPFVRRIKSPRGDAEPRDGRVPRRLDPEGGRGDVRARHRAGRRGRLRARADRHRGPGGGQDLHRRLVHGRRPRWRRQAGRHGRGLVLHRSLEQAHRAGDRRHGSGGVREGGGAPDRDLVPPVAPHRALPSEGERSDGDGVTVAPAPARKWDPQLLCVGIFGAVFVVGLPLANALGLVSDYYLNLFGKYLALAILALGTDLIWGYTGILSLGQAIFFGIGAYSIGMHMLLESSGKGVYGERVPDFMIWNQVYQLPLFWKPYTSVVVALASSLFLPALLATVIGFLTFRRRLRGTYFAILTQAIAFAVWLMLNRNEMKLGGTNGLTDFKSILGVSLSSPGTLRALYVVTAALLVGALLASRAIVRSKTGLVLEAIRDNERRLEFLGYNTAGFKIFVFAVSAALAGLAGLLYAPQVGIITPSQVGVLPSLE